MRNVWKQSLLLTFVSCISALATAGDISSECLGCHDTNLQQPAKLSDLGVGIWEDKDCVGCHIEYQATSDRYGRGERDPKVWKLPISLESFKRISKHKMSYLHAPEKIKFAQDNRQRIDPDRLLTYLQRPPSRPIDAGQRGSMMAYPEIGGRSIAGVVSALFYGSSSTQIQRIPMDEQQTHESVKRGRQTFENLCGSCHGGNVPSSGRSSAYLSLFTPEWIESYSNGKVSTPLRVMPTIAITREQSMDLSQFFATDRTSMERQVDAAVNALPPVAVGVSVKVNDALNHFMWKSFFRTARCVHCHDGTNAAAKKFRASGTELQTYLENGGAAKIVNRLQIRALEFEVGVTSKTPGMPMTQPPLDQTLIKMVEQWVKSGCRKPEDPKSYCGNQSGN